MNPRSVIHRDREILSGTPVFIGTRVPVRILFEYLAAGDSLEAFLDAFPSVSKDQVVAALELASDILEHGARSAGCVGSSAARAFSSRARGHHGPAPRVGGNAERMTVSASISRAPRARYGRSGLPVPAEFHRGEFPSGCT